MKNLNERMQIQFQKMMKTGKLFRSSVSGKELWKVYLESFKDEDNPIFRDPDSTVHNCNHCKNFVRRYGNIVSINDNFEIETIFDVDASDEYRQSLEEMNKLLKTNKITSVFTESFNELKTLPYESCNKSQEIYKLGIPKNYKRYTKKEAEQYGVVKPNEVRTFHHFYLDLSSIFVDKTEKSIDTIVGDFRADYDVFKRTMEEIPLDTLKLVADLIKQGSLLNGDAHLYKIEAIIPLKKEYDELPPKKRDNWCWLKSYKFQFARFKNELIGVLCNELAEGEDLNKACLNWNKRVDPANYMKAVAPITETQKRNAQKFIEENGYVESFDRRFATFDDINVVEIKHINSGDGTIKQASIFDKVKTAPSRHKRAEFDKVEEVFIDKFMNDILPTCESVELFLENRLENNLVTITTADNDSKQIFKWDNPFSYTYKGNLAGKSEIREAVKSHGGKVDGVLRFSIMWSEGDSNDNSDLDAHCILPNKKVIYYSEPNDSFTKGNLDIDITDPTRHKKNNRKVVENITFPSISNMFDGEYTFLVHQYSARRSKGFKAEIEFNGEIFQYEYKQPLGNKQKVQVAVVTFKNGQFSIDHKLKGTNSSKVIWGLETNKFHKVNLMALSPNYWGSNNVGNKHYFFMLDKCYSDEAIRSFHSENLLPELVKHRKVLDVLGAVTMLEPKKEQLAGVGFNATVKNEVILRLKGSHKRLIKLKF